MLDTFVAAEGSPEVVQFSGGEPTIHPQILDFVALAQAKGISFGDAEHERDPARPRPRASPSELAALAPHVYLQFDGFEAATHLAIRGQGPARRQGARARALRGAGLDRDAGLRGREGRERARGGRGRSGSVSPIRPCARSRSSRSRTRAGTVVFDPLERLTNADVMKLAAAQAPEWLRVADFVPVPCCFPTCRSMCYGLVTDDGLVPLARLRRDRGPPRLPLQPRLPRPGAEGRARAAVLVVRDSGGRARATRAARAAASTCPASSIA